jgi:DNA polymerase-1
MALSILTKICSNPLVAIDTETNGLDVRDGRGICFGVSIATPEYAMYLPFRHENMPEQNFDLHAFLPLLQAIIDNSTVIYHNAKFDLISLQTLGLKTLGRKFVDTMILAHLVDENRPWQGKSLDACTKYYLEDGGKRKDPDYEWTLKSIGYAEMTAELTAKYATWDAWLTYQLYEALLPKLREEQLGAVWNHKAKMVELLTSMEGHGISIDTDLCEHMAELGGYEMDRLRAELDGLNPSSTNDLHSLLIGRLGLPVVKLTPKGKPCFDKWAMKEYEEILEVTKNRDAQRILAYRGWQKSCSSNYKPYVALQSPDLRLRPDYLLHGTVTGRMSCRYPNLQQIPKSGVKPWNGKMKQCFIPRQGYVLIEGDYSQLEFRLSSSFAKVAELLAIFNDPTRDVFQEIADLLGMSRDEAKTLVYSILYGAGANRIKNVFGVSLAEGQQIRDNFFRLYPNLLKASRYASNYATAKKRIPLWSGRYRHFINVKEEAHRAYNSLVQGGAADIVERTMVRADEQGLNSPDCSLLLQVHDSMVWEVREDMLGAYIPEIKRVMEAVEPDFGVNFKASVHQWGEKDDFDLAAYTGRGPKVLV